MTTLDNFRRRYFYTLFLINGISPAYLRRWIGSLNVTAKQSDYVADPFNRKEIQALLAQAELELKPLIQLAFFTGLRPSELIALQWQDIDWVNGLAHIRRAVVERQEKCTKTIARVSAKSYYYRRH